MNYEFPIIETIDDVLPHVKDWEAIGVYERPFGTVINYQVVTPGLFDLDIPGGAMRRECRGIIFDLEGRIASRPFHKFFNVNEKEETQIHNLDMNEAHSILEKADGSMIRAIWHEDTIRLATKMGITDISVDAEKLLGELEYLWLKVELTLDRTPLFEYIAPDNRIVVNYSEPKLVYLGTRHNITGEYFFSTECPFETIKSYGSLGDKSLSDYIENARKEKGREGDIIRFKSGHMLKIKNDWYVSIHKAKEKILFDRNIILLDMNNEMDDIIPFLDEFDRIRIKNLIDEYWKDVLIKEKYLIGFIEKAKTMTRKEVALELVPTMKHKKDASIIFRFLDGGNLFQELREKTIVATNSNAKFEEHREWLKAI